MCLHRPDRTHIVAVLLTAVAALFARAWLQIWLVEAGYERGLAGDLSYLVVPPIMLLLLAPVLVEDRRFVQRQFRRDSLSSELLLKAVAIGVLFRVAWHGQVVAGTAFGFYSTGSARTAVFIYDCPAPFLMGLSVLISSFFIPFIEEFVHRGYVQSYFSTRGPVVAVTISSLIFVLFHRSEAWEFVLPGGLLLGAIYWITGSLWASVIVHATVNFVPQLTLRCMAIPWPRGDVTSPIWGVAIVSTMLAFVSLVGLILLTVSLAKRRDTRPRHHIA